MVNKVRKLNKRQEMILENFEQGKEYASSEIVEFFTTETEIPSQTTLGRDISELVSLGFLEQKGKLKGTTYLLTILGMVNAPIDAHRYCSIETDQRNAKTQYNLSLFNEFPNKIFTKEEIEGLDVKTKLFTDKSQNASSTIQKKELERFVIELSWKSSKIEGNTYTILDTELLLKEGTEAKGHTKDEAIMILNHKKAFQYILSVREKWQKPNVRQIEDVHRLLVEELNVSFGLRTRSVGITGSKYLPLAIPTQIHEALNDLCIAIDRIKNPYEKALLALVGISYIQPFEDGNKRTARLFANAILLAYGCAPLSYRNVDEKNYRESILVFYEKNSIVPMRKIFTEQYFFACENYLKF